MARMVADKLEAFRGEGVEVVVVEAALLFEAGWDSLVDEVWATDSAVDTVVQRLRDRNGMTEEEVLKRIGSQMDREERLERADLVVDNSGDVDTLRTTVQSLWEARVNGRIERG